MSISDELLRLVGEPPEPSSTHRATVLRTDNDGTTWVSIPGGADETPLHGTLVECAPGDVVDVTIANGRATATANATSPAATGRTVGVVRETAETAQLTANDAAEAAASAIEDATLARTAADNAQASARDAETAAGAASIAADNAQVAANAATFALSDVEKVVGTLEWIAEHGEYQLTTDTAVVAGKVYYTRSGTSPNYTYTVVAEPRTADIATYYELHMDESVQNFIATHLWLDQYGLNLSVDSSNGYRIHQGTVDGTKTMGMYVLDSTGAAVASFGTDGAQIGRTSTRHAIVNSDGLSVWYNQYVRAAMFGETTHIGRVRRYQGNDTYLAASLNIDYNSLSMKDINQWEFFNVRDLHDTVGAPITEEFPGDGTTKVFTLSHHATQVTSIDVDGTAYASSSDWSLSDWTSGGKLVSRVTLAARIAAPQSYCIIEYKTDEPEMCAFTFGTRRGDVGNHSFTMGRNNRASGNFACAQNDSTIAASESQTALGKYNVEDANDQHAVIIGNGTSDSARSNALTVGWDGSVDAAGDASIAGDAAIGGTLGVTGATTHESTIYVNGANVNNMWMRDGYANADYDGVPSSGANTTRTVGMIDSDDDQLARVSFRQRSDGRRCAGLEAHGFNSGGTGVWNSLWAVVDKAGNRSYEMSDPAAFREALRIRSGVVATRSVAAGSVEPVNVTFSPALSAPPNVVCGLQSTQTQLMGNCSCVVTATSATGFTVALVNNSSSARNLGCYWIAM